MFSGWINKWKLNRPIKEDEKEAELSRKRDLAVELDPTSVVAYNSTYMEVVDRAYRQRGGWYTLIAILSGLALIGVFLWAVLSYGLEPPEMLYGYFVLGMGIVINCFVVWLYVLRKDLFCHTYYPIRFNRKNRMVYVYREERDGGILRLPWDEGFYHIGRGLADKDIIDLRCHVLDGDTVKDTFAIGLYFHTSEQDRIRGLWEQIRTYMDDGAKVAKPEYIMMSMAPTWKNAYIRVGGLLRAHNLIVHIIVAPLMYPLVACRWLVM